MDVDEFRADLSAEVRNAAINSGQSASAAFAEKIVGYMREAEYLNGDFQEAFFIGKNPKHYNSNLRVDGWLQDEADDSIALFVVHYDDGVEPMTTTLANKNFKLLEEFVLAVLTGNVELEESTSAAELAEILRASVDVKFKFFLLTNVRRGVKLRDVGKFFVRDSEVDCQIWDIERIFAAYNSMQVREPVRIDFSELGGGLPCLRAANAGDECESFLCVIPGKILADIYDLHGSRLLEGNVRSFLSTKRSVNKKIRATILNQPEKFFAFNNGIAATATQLELENFGGGLFITAATDFQIINGGQTTASLLNARLRDKAALEKIFVQMKLTRIGDMPTDSQEKLIGEISRSSNSQNKVSEADFFSMHPFHVEMEKISRRILTPAKHGVQYQTHWFYERARGQYVQEQLKLSAREKKSFQCENPKSQVMSKTDLAKYRMSWHEHPDIVSKGAQTNFMRFAEQIGAAWEKNSAQFNEHYFKETVALAIMFRAVEKIVSRQPWYKNSYRANIVTYSLAIFHHALSKKFPDAELNLLKLWRTQEFPAAWTEIFATITLTVNDFITGERPITNVTQWCKQSTCWQRMKQSVRVELPENFSAWMIGANEVAAEKKSARKIQRTSFDVDAQSKILSFSGATWRKIFDDAARKNFLTPDEKSALSTAMAMGYSGKLPSPSQCQKLLRLLERLEDDGLTYAPDAEL